MDEKEIEEIITKAIVATRRACAQETKDAAKSTENRLSAFLILRKKIEDDEKRANGENPTFEKGVEIAEDKQEIEELQNALSMVESDSYYDVIKLRFLEGLTLAQIAEQVNRDISTVRRNKTRLVRQMSVYLYGARAVK